MPQAQECRFKSVSQRQYLSLPSGRRAFGLREPPTVPWLFHSIAPTGSLLFADEWIVTLNTLGPLVAQMVKNPPEKQDMQV